MRFLSSSLHARKLLCYTFNSKTFHVMVNVDKNIILLTDSCMLCASYVVSINATAHVLNRNRKRSIQLLCRHLRDAENFARNSRKCTTKKSYNKIAQLYLVTFANFCNWSLRITISCDANFISLLWIPK